MIVIKALAIHFIGFVCLFYSISVSANGILSTNYLFKSKFLQYDLNYRVYTPNVEIRKSLLPTLYLTDGQWYLSSGDIKKTLDKLIASKKISPTLSSLLTVGIRIS